MALREAPVRQPFAALALAVAVTACNIPGTDDGSLGMDNLILPDMKAGSQGASIEGAVDLTRPTGTRCKSDDPDQLCLALKYVAFKDAQGAPSPTENEAETVVKKINELWKQCSISFHLENYVSVDPIDHELQFRTSNYSELTDIRETFQDDRTLLIVTTGAWNRSGSLGNTGANAWTAMPGGGPYGAILERPVATNANLISHEIGHYLNLPHVSDSLAMMNPVIYQRSVKIYGGQCETARSAAQYFWPKALRSSI